MRLGIVSVLSPGNNFRCRGIKFGVGDRIGILTGYQFRCRCINLGVGKRIAFVLGVSILESGNV
eukprot:1452720-Pyramimonas_sp.AAC.1